MAAALAKVGGGLLKVDDIPRLLALRDRTRAPPPAPPAGLYLWEVHYPGLAGAAGGNERALARVAPALAAVLECVDRAAGSDDGSEGGEGTAGGGGSGGGAWLLPGAAAVGSCAGALPGVLSYELELHDKGWACAVRLSGRGRGLAGWARQTLGRGGGDVVGAAIAEGRGAVAEYTAAGAAAWVDGGTSDMAEAATVPRAVAVQILATTLTQAMLGEDFLFFPPAVRAPYSPPHQKG